jgi:hypothetical protein
MTRRALLLAMWTAVRGAAAERTSPKNDVANAANDFTGNTAFGPSVSTGYPRAESMLLRWLDLNRSQDSGDESSTSEPVGFAVDSITSSAPSNAPEAPIGQEIAPMMLLDAISAVEAASTDLSNADTAKAAAQSKFDAAKAAKETADQSDTVAEQSFNASLDALITAATAAKRGPAAPPAPDTPPAV